MEGLIPFVYRAITQYKNGKQGPIGAWFSESPSYSYMRLPGDSGRFQPSEIKLFGTDYSLSASSAPSKSTNSNPQIVVSSRVQSPVRRFTARRVAA